MRAKVTEEKKREKSRYHRRYINSSPLSLSSHFSLGPPYIPSLPLYLAIDLYPERERERAMDAGRTRRFKCRKTARSDRKNHHVCVCGCTCEGERYVVAPRVKAPPTCQYFAPRGRTDSESFSALCSPRFLLFFREK